MRYSLDALEASGTPGVARARRALAGLLAPLSSSAWPEVSWRFSRLTGDGYPFELTCCTAPHTRYTLEVGPPELPDHQRLPVALALLGTAGGSADAQVSAALRELQRGRPLRYGAWLGGRHTRTADAYKVYAEVPAGASWVTAAPLLGALPVGSHCSMVGLASDGSQELYFRVPALTWEDLERLCGRHGLQRHLPALTSLIQRLSGRTGLPPTPTGLSVTLRSGQLQSVALIVAVRDLIGGDGAAQAVLAPYFPPQSGYARVSQPLAGRSGPYTRHSALSFALSAAGLQGVAVGLRPTLPEQPLSQDKLERLNWPASSSNPGGGPPATPTRSRQEEHHVSGRSY